jgi:hypothetical protein
VSRISVNSSTPLASLPAAVIWPQAVCGTGQWPEGVEQLLVACRPARMPLERDGEQRLRICRFYKKRTGTCKFGAACIMSHPSDNDADSSASRSLPIVTSMQGAGDRDFMSLTDCGNREQDSDKTIKLCGAWINSGRCPKKDACELRHGTCGVPIGKARAEWVAQVRQRRAEMPSTSGDDVPVHEKQSYRSRASVLAQFIIDTFHREDLDNGVLDVAGGRGDLSFELTVLHSLRCTVVDPRPVRLNKHQVCSLAKCLTLCSIALCEHSFVAQSLTY